MNRRQLLALFATSGVSLTGLRLPNVAAQDVMRGDDPMAAAERLSELETMEYLPPLYEFYGYLHEDAQALIPRSTVIGWYQEDFHPRQPQPAVATGVRYLDSWTWDVTGTSYADVAEVSFTQQFADGEVNDVVRLVFHDHAWRWFFGRDKAWVDEQNLRFSQKEHLDQSGVAPFGLDAVTSLAADVLQRLPTTIYDEEFQTEYELRETAGSHLGDGTREPTHKFRYVAINPKSEFDLGSVEYGNIIDSASDAEALDKITSHVQSTPPTELLAWNTEPESGPAYVHTTTPGVDVVGQSWQFIIVLGGSYLQVSMYSEASLVALAQTIAGTTA